MVKKTFSDKVERNGFYKFCRRHDRVIKILEGLFIVALLISINTYVVRDHFIKKQIKERCGYTTSKIECVCEKSYVDIYRELQRGELNLTIGDYVPPTSSIPR